jgi:hypothetical protein
LRDFILCAVIVTIVSSATTVAQRSFANLTSDRTIPHAELSPRLQLSEQSIEPNALPGVWIKDIAGPGKPDAQPSLASPRAVVPTARPEKKMVGPDGVTFTRSATTPRKVPAVVWETRPIAPELLGLEDQAKAADPQSVVKSDSNNGPIDAATASNGAREQSTLPAKKAETMKTSGAMVGPDGITYRPTQGARSATPH